MKTIERRCRECGVGTVRAVAGKGRSAGYKNMQLPVPEDLKVLTCDSCGARWFDQAGAEAFDAAMEKVYQEAMKQRLEVLIDKVRPTSSMRQVELLLGLSEGYLSKVKQGRSQPSAQLVSALGLLVGNLDHNILLLKTLWGTAESKPAAKRPLGVIAPAKSPFTGEPRVYVARKDGDKKSGSTRPFTGTPRVHVVRKKGKKSSSKSGTGRRVTA